MNSGDVIRSYTYYIMIGTTISRMNGSITRVMPIVHGMVRGTTY